MPTYWLLFSWYKPYITSHTYNSGLVMYIDPVQSFLSVVLPVNRCVLTKSDKNWQKHHTYFAHVHAVTSGQNKLHKFTWG